MSKAKEVMINGERYFIQLDGSVYKRGLVKLDKEESDYVLNQIELQNAFRSKHYGLDFMYKGNKYFVRNDGRIMGRNGEFMSNEDAAIVEELIDSITLSEEEVEETIDELVNMIFREEPVERTLEDAFNDILKAFEE